MHIDIQLIDKLISQAQSAPIVSAQTVNSLLDLTRLVEGDDPQNIIDLCRQAQEQKVAAVCVYPEFIDIAKQNLQDPAINIASVINFPQGTLPLARVQMDIERVLNQDVDEIDLVFPYQAYLQGETEFAIDFVRRCKDSCAGALLKVILETGAFQEDAELIARASQDVIAAGADFIKTSTGKIQTGATLTAAVAMLLSIKQAKEQGKEIGFKASGGIRSLTQAAEYLYLAEVILGKAYIKSSSFRFGASQISAD